MRADLVELTPAILTALSNAGLVKRAQREVQQGKFGDPQLGSDESITVSTDDGNVVTFPPGSGLHGTCTCGATALCRHRIGAVLQIREMSETPSGVMALSISEAGTPAEEKTGEEETAVDTRPTTEVSEEQGNQIDEDYLRGLPVIADGVVDAFVAKKVLTSAQKLRTNGFIATVARGDIESEEPCVVALGTATVRFLLGGDLRYARCDCKLRAGCEHVVLAVWAMQQACAARTDTDTIVVGVGGTKTALSKVIGLNGDADSESVSIERAIHQLLQNLLIDGFANVGSSFALRLATVRRIAEHARHGWTVVLIDRLGDLHSSLLNQSSVDIQRAVADVVGSIAARYRAATASTAPDYGGLPVQMLLGTTEKSETALAQLRLTGAGAIARRGAIMGSCDIDVMFVDPANSMMLVTKRTFRTTTTESGVAMMVPTGASTASITPVSSSTASAPNQLTGPDVGARSLVKGGSLNTAASGSLISNAAVRRPDRRIDFRVGGLRRTSVVGGGATIERFRDAGLVCEPSEIIRSWVQRAPKVVRPPLATEDIVVLEIARIVGSGFDPGEQCVIAHVETTNNESAVLRCDYRDVCPGAPAALANFVNGDGAGFVVGRANVRNGVVTIEPTLLAGHEVDVPAFAKLTDQRREMLAAMPLIDATHTDDERHFCLDQTERTLGELAISGVRSSIPIADELRQREHRLRALGLHFVASQVGALAEILGMVSVGSHEADVATAWGSAAIAVSIAQESDVEVR
jgi:hypothetical protein